ncbi:hypothetical protein B0J11DRAFT_604516 [Dendryphion nanum]|uniref:Uncharacterized protein n=1 Tax=Dendryphion nanum TaxID=256645 RepID=A0A9P9INE2_9PLEO|nr:hypothetical protein B0J11DRAFT_604516 [Dendryphion nanum]
MEFPEAWSHGDDREHYYIDTIRAGIDQYRSKSYVRFAQDLQVHQVRYHVCRSLITSEFRLDVIFQDGQAGLEGAHRRTCRARFERNENTGEVEVLESNRWVSLDESLSMNYPTQAPAADPDNLRKWLAVNGKRLHWVGFPGELKENILAFCLLESPGFAAYHSEHLFVRKSDQFHQHGPWEVTHQLGHWVALLAVSKEIRQITLELCLKHNNRFPGGLMIASKTPGQLVSSIKRLSRAHIFIDKKLSYSPALARQYLLHPKVYTELGNPYATYAHNIRKISFNFDFLSNMFFFGVTVAGLDRCRPKDALTCTIFDRLPLLDGIRVSMPRDVRNVRHPVKLFDEDLPCYRILHRYLYERLATVLAPYTHVTVTDFIDKEEEDRFLALLKLHRKSSLFTAAELEDMYADTSGGIEIDVPVSTLVRIQKDETYERDAFRLAVQRACQTYPPICRCQKKCVTIGF